MQRRRRYAQVGSLLGIGAPLGLLALRSALFRRKPTLSAIAAELRSQAVVYSYVGGATTAVFGVFGYLLGRAEDRRRVSQREAERLREEHAQVVAHDLRNPISTITLQCEMLQHAKEDDRASRQAGLDRITMAAQRLAVMVGQLADATQIELARVKLDLRTTSLPDVVDALLERLRPTLGTHPIHLEVESAPGLVAIDPVRFDEILTNIIENAAKYSPEGAPIRVTLSTTEGGALVSVRDEGMGITAEELPYLFDRYYQSKRARAQKTGLGLGLFITKGLVEAHKGHLRVHSQPGRGSTFSVWFPGARKELGSRDP